MMTNDHATVAALGRDAPLLTLDYATSNYLRYDQSMRLFVDGPATAAAVYDAIGLLREGVVMRKSAFHIAGFGLHRFNVVIDWLCDCGYPAEVWRIPPHRKTA